MTDVPPPQPAFQQSAASNRYLLIIGGIMLVGILFLAWVGKPPLAITIGKPLPELDLQPLLDGTPPINNADLQGKLTVLHFWGTWCPPCKEEFPEFAKLSAQYADNSQVVLASISCSGGAEYDLDRLRRATQSFMEQVPNAIPTYADPAAMTRERVAWILPRGSLGYPTTLLVDRDGTIIHLIEGYYPGEMEELAQKIKSKL